MNEPTKTPPPQRRATIGRVRGYFFTWLLSAFAVAGAFLTDYVKKAALPGDVKHGSLTATIFGGAIIALLSLPILFLLRVVPENSTTSGVRLLRRVIVGSLCGWFLGALLAGLIAAFGTADSDTAGLAGAGAIFGLIAGLIDSIALDDPAESRRDDGDSDVGGPPS